MRTIPFALCLLGLPLCVQAGPLNDTGIDFCRNAALGADITVTLEATCTDAEGGQDARYGRDAAASKGLLPKVGGGSKGFDFTKIANNGTTLPADAVLGAGPTAWACTYDNNTGLMWEVKVPAGYFRGQDDTFSWYDSQHYLGTANGGLCYTAGHCDTEKFVADVNAANLCNHHDWRMPTRNELANLVDYGRRTGSAIDPDYFPNSPVGVGLNDHFWWSGSPTSSPTVAWAVRFDGHGSMPVQQHAGFRVRLVRTGP